MHQCLIQWHGDDVELVRADESISIAIADLVFWELGDFECFSAKTWEGGFIKISNERQQSMKANSRCKRLALRVCFSRKVSFTLTVGSKENEY